MISLFTILGVLALALGVIWYATRKRPHNSDGIDQISDPREAASLAMVAVAQADGPMSDAAHAAIVSQVKQRFTLTADEANALVLNTQMMLREGADAADIIQRLLPLFQTHFNQVERRQLVEMLSAVAHADGRHDELAAFDIYRLSRELGLP